MDYSDSFYYKRELYMKPSIPYHKSSSNSYKIKNLFFRKKIIEFIETMEKNFSSETLNIMYYNLDSLKIKGILFDSKCDAIYIIEQNKIKVKYNYLRTIDHELIHMSSSFYDDDFHYSGFSLERFSTIYPFFSIGRPLTEGFTEKYAIDLFPEYQRSNAYKYYAAIARLLEKIVGNEKCSKLFFSANLSGFVDELSNYRSFFEIADFLKCLDYLHYSLSLNEQFCKNIFGKNFIPMMECMQGINSFLGEFNSPLMNQVEEEGNKLISKFLK